MKEKRRKEEKLGWGNRVLKPAILKKSIFIMKWGGGNIKPFQGPEKGESISTPITLDLPPFPWSPKRSLNEARCSQAPTALEVLK